MSIISDVKNQLESFVGEKLCYVVVNESSYGDGQTSSVTLTFSNGEEVTFSTHGYNDGSTVLDVD